MVEELSLNLREDKAPNNLGTTVNVGRLPHVTAIQETACKETEWHIVRLLKTSLKACFTQQAITKKKCTTKIVQDNRIMAAPTYTSVMVNWKKNKGECMRFFFCNDDIEKYVKGTRQRWVESKSDVPSIWPVKIGTNLSKKEILTLENVGFYLPQRAVISPRRLFGMEELPFASQTSRSLENNCFSYVFHQLVVSCKFHSISFAKFVCQI
jgi:hypothetical protein